MIATSPTSRLSLSPRATLAAVLFVAAVASGCHVRVGSGANNPPPPTNNPQGQVAQPAPAAPAPAPAPAPDPTR